MDLGCIFAPLFTALLAFLPSSSVDMGSVLQWPPPESEWYHIIDYPALSWHHFSGFSIEIHSNLLPVVSGQMQAGAVFGHWPSECEWKVAISIITSRSAWLEEMHLCRLSSDKTCLCSNKDQDAAGKAGIFTDHWWCTMYVSEPDSPAWVLSWG